MSFGCKIQTSIWSFVYVHTLLSTIFLTLERYFLITKPFTYDYFVNWKTVKVAIGLSWTLPLIFGISGYLEDYSPTNLCNPSHTDNKLRTILGELKFYRFRWKIQYREPFTSWVQNGAYYWNRLRTELPRSGWFFCLKMSFFTFLSFSVNSINTRLAQH